MRQCFPFVGDDTRSRTKRETLHHRVDISHPAELKAIGLLAKENNKWSVCVCVCLCALPHSTSNWKKKGRKFLPWTFVMCMNRFFLAPFQLDDIGWWLFDSFASFFFFTIFYLFLAHGHTMILRWQTPLDIWNSFQFERQYPFRIFPLKKFLSSFSPFRLLAKNGM